MPRGETETEDIIHGLVAVVLSRLLFLALSRVSNVSIIVWFFPAERWREKIPANSGPH